MALCRYNPGHNRARQLKPLFRWSGPARVGVWLRFWRLSRSRRALPSPETLPRNSPQKLWSGCRGYWGDLVSEAGGLPLELLNLEFAVFEFVEGCSSVHVFHPVAEHAVDQAGQLGRHRLDGNGGTELGS